MLYCSNVRKAKVVTVVSEAAGRFTVSMRLQVGGGAPAGPAQGNSSTGNSEGRGRTEVGPTHLALSGLLVFSELVYNGVA